MTAVTMQESRQGFSSGFVSWKSGIIIVHSLIESTVEVGMRGVKIGFMLCLGVEAYEE